MTNQAHGSSLLQARGNHQHLHDHHNRLHARNPETNHHVRDNQHHHHPHVRSSEELQNKKLQDRQVVVVQTLSVVHIVNGAGTVVGVKTLAHSVGQTQSLKSPAGVTTVDSDTLGINTTPSVPAVTPSVGDGVAPLPTEKVATGVVPGSESSSSLSTNSGNLSGSLTSAPFSSSTRFPTLSGPGGFFSSNSTRGPSFFGNSTVKTPHSLFLNTSRPVTVLATKSKSSSTRSRSSTTLWTTTPDVPIVTPAVGPGAGNPGFVDATPAAPIPTASDPAPKGLTPETQGAVAGGVVGGVAGIALIVFFAMFLMRWKKRHGGAIRLLGDGESTARGGVGHGPGSGPGGLGGGDGDGGDMVERRSIPFAIPASLASLTGQKRLIEGSAASEPAPQGNKGFYRVSGKKLISVLQSGGDGYSDPHASMLSTSSFYRDSTFPDSLPPQRLQLGSPMRPESGIPIMRSGPGRTPIQEQTSFSFDTPRPLTSPTTPPVEPSGADPLGRSLISQDRSRVSGTGSGRTRFTEEI